MSKEHRGRNKRECITKESNQRTEKEFSLNIRPRKKLLTLILIGLLVSTSFFVLVSNETSATPSFGVPERDPEYPNATEPVNVSIEISDNQVITAAMLYYSYDGVAWSNTTMALSGGGIEELFNETFPTTTISSSNWASIVSSPVIKSEASNEPSAPYSLDMDGTGDTITSVMIDLSSYTNVNISFFYEMGGMSGGGGERPDPDDHLYLEYYNNVGSWVTLWQQDGDTQWHSNFVYVEETLPANGYHTNFRFRFRTEGSGNNYDDFYLDDIKVMAPGAKANGIIPGPGFSSWVYYYINATNQIDEESQSMTYSYYADGTPPAVVNWTTPIGLMSSEENITIYSNITDDYYLDFVLLWYDIGFGWTSTAMSSVAGNQTNATYRGDIPPAQSETTIFYYIEVFDKASNSNVSTTENYFTNYPPMITNVAYIPQYPNGTTQATIYANVTDADGVSSVTLFYSTDGTIYTSTPMGIISGTVYNSTIPPTGFTTTLYYYITATDTNGVSNSSSVFTLFVDADPPELDNPIAEPEFPNASNDVNVTIGITDQLEVINATIYYSYDGGTWYNTSMNNLGSTGSFYEYYVESGPSGWVHYNLTGPAGDNWVISSVKSVSPFNSWYSGMEPSNNWGDSCLESPLILNLPTYTNLTFWHWYEFYPSFEIDGGIVEINAGSGWVQIFPEGGYDDYLRTGYQNPLEGMEAYTLTSGGWQQETFNLSTYAGMDIKIRFHVGWNDINDGPREGWYIDDIIFYSDFGGWKAIIPGPGYSTWVYYYVQATDQANNTNTLTIHSYYVDGTLPNVINTSDITGPVATNVQIPIFANITDNYGFDFNNVYLWYDNGTGWTNVPMNFVFGNYTNATFQAFIPPSNIEATVFYYVEIVDNASNANVSTTKSYLTNLPPDIKDVAYLPQYPNGTSLVAVYANITDSDGISSATLYYSTDGITYTPIPMGIFNGNTYNGTIPEAGAGPMVYFYINAVDINGFVVNSTIYSYLIDNQPPVISIPYIDPLYPNKIEMVNVSFQVTDDGAIGSTTLYYSYDGVLWYTSTVYFIGGIEGIGDILFNETFPTTSINSFNWASIVSSPIISTWGINEPSFPYSLELDSTDDTITSVVMDLSNYNNISINFSYEMGGGGNAPESSDWLYLDYYTSSGSWVNLWSQNGDGMIHNTFDNVRITLPSDAYHANFQFRFRSWGSSGDDFYIDDIRVYSVRNAYSLIPGPGYPSMVYYYINATDKSGNAKDTSIYSYLAGSDLSLTMENITFDRSPAENGTNIQINAIIFNSGGNLVGVEVRFYNGDPDTDNNNIIDIGAKEIGTSIIIDLASNGYTKAATTFISPDIGVYEIYVWADAVNGTWEFDEWNNLATDTLSVYHWVDTFDDQSKTESKKNITISNGDAFIGSGMLNGRNWTRQGMVLDIGASGEPDDGNIMEHTVLNDDGTYKLWYSGYDGSRYRIMYAESLDGISWTKLGVVLSFGASGAPDDVHAFVPAVIKDLSAPSSQRYKMWYTGYDGSIYYIMYATSSDGLTWSKQGVVMNEGSPGDPDDSEVRSYKVVKENDVTYKMWYTGYDGTYLRVCYATSTDGITWIKQGVVLDIGASGALDDRHVSSPSIVQDENDMYHMWYTGYDSSRYRIFYAISDDGINWIRRGLALDLGPPGSYDDYFVCYASVILDSDGYYKMWYCGVDGSYYRLMYATLSPDSFENYYFDFEGNDEGFTLESNQPYSYVTWDSANQYVAFRADRQDSNDEMFLRYLDENLDENSHSWSLGARFMITTNGNNQYAIPLFIGKSSNTNIYDVPNTIYFYYYSGTGEARAKYMDSLGNSRIFISYSINQNTEYHVSAIYDMGTKKLTLQLLDINDNVLTEGSYIIGSSPSDGFTFGKLGVGTHGTSGSSTSDCFGWTDDINLDLIYEDGTLTSKAITLPADLTWYELFMNKTEPGSTYITVTILDASTGIPIPGYVDLQGDIIDISGIKKETYPSIKLVANFKGNSAETPILHYWAMNWIPPVEADAGWDDYVDEDIPYIFDGSGSWSSVGISNYAWDIDEGDGIDWTNPDYEGPNIWNPTHIYDTPGIYVVTLNVTDINGYWDIDTMIITVNDTTPPAVNPGSDDSIDEDFTYTFDANGTLDNSGTISSYLWDIDASDGVDWNNPDYFGVSPEHIFIQPGIYLVTLKVIDASGNFDTATITIFVNDITDPVAHAGSDGSMNEDDIYSFDGSGSSDNVGIVYYNWTFGDGSYDFGTNFTMNHIYTAEGNYVVVLRVTDGTGNWNEDSLTIMVNNVIPVADAGSDQTINEGETLIFDGGGSWDTPSDLDTLINIWYFGDGFVGAGIVTTHIYSSPGNYTVLLLVNDNDGASTSDTMTVTVIDASPPVADAGPDAVIDQNSPCTFDASGSYDNIGIANYTWDMDASGGVDWNNPDYIGSDLIYPIHTYSIPGAYIITLKVTDTHGYWDMDTMVLTVKDVTSPLADAREDGWANQYDAYQFDGSDSTDNIDIVTYQWDIDSSDGIHWSSPDYTGAKPVHIFSEPGVYIVTLRVFDEEGNFGTDTVTIRVNETIIDETIPIAPTGVEVLLLTRNDALNIHWNEPTTNADGSVLTDLDHYELYYRAGENNEFKKLTDLAAGTTSYIHSGLTTNAIYYYHIVAVDSLGTTSPPSITVSGMPNLDSDGDQIPDISDLDDDNDDHPDSQDEFPLDSTRWKTDKKGFDWFWILLVLIVVLLSVILLLGVKRFKTEKEPTEEGPVGMPSIETPETQAEEQTAKPQVPIEKTPPPPPLEPVVQPKAKITPSTFPPPPPPPPPPSESSEQNTEKKVKKSLEDKDEIQ